MIKFFRKIRQKLLQENRVSKYLLYAFGEIVLVVIGILIALQINNWNEENKNRIKEKEALEGIKTALKEDLDLYERVYQPRFNRKKQGLEFFKNAAFYNLQPPEDSLYRNYFRMKTDIIFRNDTGPYDALKSAGFELIKNKELRKEIINTYEVIIPGFTRFINDFNDEKVQLEQEYQKDLLSNYVVKKENGELDVYIKFKVDNLLTNSSFLSFLSIEQGKYSNYISRMEVIKKTMTNLINLIDKELNHD